jgi:hypothetical protein
MIKQDLSKVSTVGQIVLEKDFASKSDMAAEVMPP